MPFPAFTSFSSSSPKQSPSLAVGTKLPSQLSVAVAIPNEPGVMLSVHSIAAFAGIVSTGAVVSTILISCVAVPTLPQLSVTVNVLITTIGQDPDFVSL